MNDNTVSRNAPSRMSQRDPSKPWNQLHPRSLRSSGAELDEGFPPLHEPTTKPIRTEEEPREVE
jgi:hypothetical protein